MTDDILSSRWRGLYSDSAEEDVPLGAMDVAQNVVLRRPGILEPRPGITRDVSLDAALITPSRGSGFGSAIVVASSASAFTHASVDSSGMPRQVSTRFLFSAGPAAANTRFATQRGNLYATRSGGIAKLTAATDANQRQAGISAPPLARISPQAGTRDTGRVAYRAVFRREDANNYILRSAPSPRQIYNPSTATDNAEFTWYLPDDIEAGDVLELYRSAQNVLDEELQLAVEYTIDSADVAQGSIVFRDRTPAGELGALIYTAPSQQSIAQRNDRPPCARDIAEYQSHMFYAGTESPAQCIVEFRGEVTTPTRPSVQTYTAGNFTWTTGSASVGYSNQVGIEVGMKLKSPSIEGGSAIVVGITTGAGIVASFSISEVATSVAAAAATAFDGIRIGSSGFYLNDTTGFTTTGWGDSTYQAAYMAGMAQSINRSSDNYQAEVLYTVGQATAGNTAVTVAAIRVFAKNCDVAETSVRATPNTGPIQTGFPLPFTEGLMLEKDSRASRLHWSKLDEPEAVPFGANSTPVGNEGAILAILPTRDALYILKEDGIFVLTGQTAPNWRIDPLDRKLSLLATEAAVVYGDHVYGWFNEGVHMLSRAGTVDISYGRVDDELEALQRILEAGDRSSKGGLQMAANEQEHEVYLMIPTSADSGVSTEVLVWNDRASAWTDWVMPVSMQDMFYAPGFSRLCFVEDGGGGNGNLRVEHIVDGVVVNSDAIEAGAVTVTNGVVTGASGLEVGDALVSSVSHYIVTATSPATFDIETLPDGTYTQHKGYECIIGTVGLHGTNPAMSKAWLDTTWFFRSLKGVVDMTARWLSDLSNTAGTSARQFTKDTTDLARRERFWCVRAHNRSQMLRPGLSIKQAFSNWQLSGFRQQYRLASRRVLRE